MTEDEKSEVKKEAVLEYKVSEISKVIPKIFNRLDSIDSGFNRIPEEFSKCKNQIDTEIRQHIQKHYITEHDLINFESKIESKMSEETNKISKKMDDLLTVGQARWAIAIVIGTVSVLFYLLEHTNIIYR